MAHEAVPGAHLFPRMSFILDRVSLAESADARYRAVADPVRRRLLRLLEDSPDPCDVQTLAGAVGLHPNTVRGHLDLLEKAELVTRSLRPRQTPGRPRVVYEATPGPPHPTDGGYRLLAELLTAAVRTSADDPIRAAEEAGRAWGFGRVARDGNNGGARPGDAEVRLVTLLDEIGFEPSMRRQGGRTVIDLNDCPFREIARRHADLVCSLHLGLMRGAAEALGETEIAYLHPFVEPSVCRTVVGPAGPDRTG